MRVETFTVTQTGVGKPDYTKEIALGRTRPGISLKQNQTLLMLGRVFSAIDSAWDNVTPPLAPGVPAAHFINWETGLESPFAVPQGYTLSAITGKYSFNQDAMLWGYFEGELYTSLGALSGGGYLYEAELVGMGTTILDPAGLLPHIYDLTVVNAGEGNLEGGVSIWGILEKVGTKPLPTTKTIRCKFCGNEWVVPNETKAINCPKCGKLNLY
ncbi:unnamed protein product, partial [marine sediment metagenome]